MAAPIARERQPIYVCEMMERLGIEPAGGVAPHLGLRYATALRLCEACPRKEACRDWLDSMPARGGDRREIGRKMQKAQPLLKSSERRLTLPLIRARGRALRLSTRRCRNGATRLCIGAAAYHRPIDTITEWPRGGIVVISNSLWVASISNNLARREPCSLIRYRHASGCHRRM